MDAFNVEFHFPYDKVTVEKVPKATAERYASKMYLSKNCFEVPILDYQGNETGNVEIINPAMVTHVRITKYLPF